MVASHEEFGESCRRYQLWVGQLEELGAAQSLTSLAQGDGVSPGRDHDGVWVLKSPQTAVGMWGSCTLRCKKACPAEVWASEITSTICRQWLCHIPSDDSHDNAMNTYGWISFPQVLADAGVQGNKS
jgi:hypothetical protein